MIEKRQKNPETTSLCIHYWNNRSKITCPCVDVHVTGPRYTRAGSGLVARVALAGDGIVVEHAVKGLYAASWSGCGWDPHGLGPDR